MGDVPVGAAGLPGLPRTVRVSGRFAARPRRECCPVGQRMRIQIHYFATLREQKGRSEEVVDLPEGLTAREAYRRVCLISELPVAFAVNQQYVSGDVVLRDGDELALLPPLGGG